MRYQTLRARKAVATYLAGGLVQTQVMSKLLLADGTSRIDLVAEDEERYLRELLNREQGVQLRLRFGEPLNVHAVNEEDNAVDLREVVPPKPTRCAVGSG